MESIGVLYQCWWLRPREHSGSECLSYFEFCAKLRGSTAAVCRAQLIENGVGCTIYNVLQNHPRHSIHVPIIFQVFIILIHDGNSWKVYRIVNCSIFNSRISVPLFFASPNLGTPCPWPPPPPRFFSGILRRSFPRIMFHDLSGGGESLHVRQLRPSTNWKQNRVADDFQISRHLNQEHNTTLSWWVKRRKCFIKCVSQLIQNGLQLGCV